ncbi:4-hydroxy-tetrahydrodipicolinate synthase [Candidatus Woesearchaeota archaeon]|nr:4-hydroxy-tetrahydrodipicolinate synthase [Candidatus Woesearchaeota archaeon]
MMELKGTYTAMITPFKDTVLDLEGFRKNLQVQIDSGVTGILPLGTTGETPTLTDEEQEQIIRAAVELGKNKVQIMIGTGSNSTLTTIKRTAKAKELGADIVLIVTPYYNKPSQTGIFNHFKAVTEAVDIPIVVYNIAGRTGVNITTDTLEKIASLPNIIGVKEASGNIEQIGEVIDRIQRKNPDFSVLSGDDSITLPLISLGGKGVISVASNLIPKKMVEFVDACLASDMGKARDLHFELLQFFHVEFIEGNPSSIKAAMNLAGMPAGDVRAPLAPVSEDAKKKIKDVMKRLM